MTLPGSRDTAGVDAVQAKVHYLVGNDPAQWTNFTSATNTRYADVYPGISLVFRQRHLRGHRGEFDFVVAPGADWRRIAMQFPGAGQININARGDAVIGATTLHKPRVFQAGRLLDARFRRDRRNRLRFEIAGVDRHAEMIIDPVVSFASYLGGEDDDVAAAVAVDASGNYYVAGTTISAQFPLVNPKRTATGGVTKTTNGGTSWAGASQGINNADVQSIAIASDGTLYAASFGGIFKSTDNAATWTGVNNGLPSYYVSGVAVSPKNPSTVYASTRAATGGGIYISTNSGATWTLAGLAGADLYFVNIDPASGAVLTGASGQAKLYRSVDNTNWNVVFSHGVKAVAFDPKIAGLVFAIYTDNGTGGYAQSTDSGITWTINSTNTLQQAVAIAAAPGVLYTASGAFIQMSTDNGVHWTRLQYSPTSARPNALAIDSVTPSTLYAGTDGGVLKSIDAGVTWTQLRTGMPNFNVYTLTVDPRNPSVVYTGSRVLDKVFVTKYSPSGNVLYSTYIGGAGSDGATGIAVDVAGNLYVTGYTGSPDFPTTAGAPQRVLGGQAANIGYVSTAPLSSENWYAFGSYMGAHDAFVTKLDPNGAIVYSTLLGGTGDDYGNSIAVDSSGNAAVAGVTASPDFPAVNAYQSTWTGGTTIFIAKVNADGTGLVFSTYMGGGQGLNARDSVAIDGAGNVLACGTTDDGNPPNFPRLNPLPASSLPQFVDGFLSKFSGTGTLLYSTPYATCRGIVADADGNAYVTGFAGTALPLVNPVQTTGRGFLSKIAPDGSKVLYATLVAGANPNTPGGGPAAIALDRAGNVYVTGNMTSSDLPIVDAFEVSRHGFTEGFITVFDASGSKIIYSTYYGDSSQNTSYAIAVDALGNAYLSGTANTGLNTTAGAPQSQVGGGIDAYVVKIAPTPGSVPTLKPSIARVQIAANSNLGDASAGSLISIYGTDLAAVTASAPSLPLSTTLGGVSVNLGGFPVPLLYVSPTQINAQIPWELSTRATANMTVTNIGGDSQSFVVFLPLSHPSLFVVPSGQLIYAATVIYGTTSLAAPVGTFPGSRPVKRGEYLQVYGTGFGPVSSTPPTGAAADAPPSITMGTVTAGVGNAGGVPADVSFAGLAPGLVGLYQINVLIPAKAVSGVQNINLSINGQVAFAAIAVE